MAELKVLEKKEKRYIFNVFDNEKAKEPAVCVFKKFPSVGKTYFKNLKELSEAEFLYKEFANDCIEKFEGFKYEGRSIELLTDFFTLPEYAVYNILSDCYIYAMKEDKFTLGE